MANYANTKIFFEGNKKQLELIEKTIIGKDNHGHPTINYSYVENLVPGIENRFIYQMFGYSQEKDFKNGYSKEEKEVFNKKVNDFIKSQGWIGSRDFYINGGHDIELEHKDNKLIIHVTFRYYCPSLFFNKIAEDFNVTVKLLEFVEGDCTFVSYRDENGKYVDAKNSAQEIVKNPYFRNYSIDVGLHTPAEIALVLIIYNKDDLAKDFIKKYNINSDDMNSSISSLEKYKKENWDMYNSSPFVGIDNTTLKKLDGMELMGKFVKLQGNTKKMNLYIFHSFFTIVLASPLYIYSKYFIL